MVQIITDSAADFEPGELAEKNIICVPLSVHFGGAEYKENENLTKAMFYHLLETHDSFPKTSQAAPFLYAQLIQQAAQAGDEILFITLSSQISGTYQNLLMMQQEEDYAHCYVVDSHSSTGGQRIIVEEAVRLRALGMTAKDIAATLENIRSRITLYACMDTLEYLYKGGRIGMATYTVGTIANIKPILNLAGDGTVRVPAKTMGARRGKQWLIDKISAVPYDTSYPFYLMYTSDISEAEKFAAMLKQQHPELPELPIIQVGAAIGTHIGPKACGFVYIAKNDGEEDHTN